MILTRLVVGPLQVNCFILADEHTREAVVIDPGDDAQEILKISGTRTSGQIPREYPRSL